MTRRVEPLPKFKPRQVCAIRLSESQANKVGGELFRLFGRDFAATPAAAIVEAARAKSSAMHQIIWGKSDSTLADEQRKVIARQLVNSIRLILPDPKERVSVPLAVNLKPSPEMKRGYVSTPDALRSEFMCKQQEEKAFSRLNAWLDEFRAWRHGQTLAPVWSGVRELLIGAAAIDDAEEKLIRATARRGRGSRKRAA